MKRSAKELQLDTDFAKKRINSESIPGLTKTPVEEALSKDLDDLTSELLFLDTLSGGEGIDGSGLKFVVLRKMEDEKEISFYLRLAASSLPFDKSLSSNVITDETEFHVSTGDRWMYSDISEGDSVRVIGTFDSVLLNCELDSYASDIYKGYVILDPDTYLSSTLIASATECAARGYYELVFPRTDPALAYPMVLGTIVHDVLEAVLLNSEGPKVPASTVEEVLRNRAIDLQVCKKTVAEAKEDLALYVMQIRNLLESKMVPGKPLGHSKYQLKEICAVEQKLIAPLYSLKGQTDVTLMLQKDEEEMLAALEIKTGKERNKHMVQTCLYALMLQELKLPVSEDQFLLYIKRGVIEAARLYKHDYKNIVRCRNKMIKLRNDFVRENRTHMSTSQGGVKCRFCNQKTFCYMYNKCFEGQSVESLEMFDEITSLKSSLTKEVEAYFKKWNTCIVFEQSFKEREDKRNPDDTNSEELTIETGVFLTHIESDNLLHMQKAGKLLSDIDVGDYVDIYCSDKPLLAMGSGQVVARDYSRLRGTTALNVAVQDGGMIGFQRRKAGDGKLFKAEWSVRRSSVGCPTYKVMRWAVMTLCCSKEHGKLRELIIEGKEPETGSVDSLEKHEDLLRRLNANQREAVRRIVQCKNYQLVQGVPGSGKSTLIAVLLQILALEKKKVLIATNTNSALDNVLIRLKEEGVKFVRISNNKDSVHPAISPFMTSQLLRDAASYEEFQLNMFSTFIFGATVYGTTTDVLRLLAFDYCIVDEASQIVEPACVAPLISAHKFVLIGDHHQLNPLVNSSKARQRGMELSLFERLCKLHPGAVTMLKKQYRMNRDIMLMSNEIVYQGMMEPGEEWVLNRELKCSHQKSEHEWINEVFNPERSVIFINTDAALSKLTPEKLSKIARSNKYECWLIFRLIAELTSTKVPETSIGVITPYVDQHKLLKRALKQYKMLDVYTIDKSQGIDKEIVVVSCVKQSVKAELLKDVRRINVAFTRAKSKLVVIGSLAAMENIETVKNYIKVMAKHKWIVDLKEIKKEKLNLDN